MPDLLLELFSEEIPARLQARAAGDLKRLITDKLVDAGLECDGARAFATPRRLVLVIERLPARQPDATDQRKGPRVGAPDKALEGFVKAAGLDDISQAEIKSDKKGDFYVAVIEKPGQATPGIVAEIVPAVMRDFPWPRSMRWGAGAFNWIRPLHGILCVFGGEIVAFEAGGVKSGDQTFGHRFMGNGKPITVKGFADYATALEKAHVILDADRRAEIILHDARDLALAQGLELIEDDALLAETAGLVEWPVVLLGAFDEAYLDVPEEVIVTSIKTHQKCFSLRHAGTGKLSNHFVVVANLIAKDGGKAIIEGNARVIAARLADAKFFWDQDRRRRLDEYAGSLSEIVFHDKLGTVADKVGRITKLAGEIAQLIGADKAGAERAAALCKADLVTGMVGEFPSLQGVMGRHYALQQGVAGDVAQAIAEHYLPQGPSDALPSTKTGQAVALADKLDTLIGFWAIDEKPTGSKDPFALRRAALGIIRIALEEQFRLPLTYLFVFAYDEIQQPIAERNEQRLAKGNQEDLEVIKSPDVLSLDLLAFFADRLKVYLRDKGFKHDRIDAVFALPGQDDLVMIVRRVEALDAFLETEAGENLLAGYKRAVNIVRIEEKKDGPGIEYSGDVDPKFFEQAEEKALYGKLEKAKAEADKALGKEDFEGAMAAMAPLRAPVDTFFDAVIVNTENKIVRRNRLCLLNQIRATLSRVADFSKIEG